WYLVHTINSNWAEMRRFEWRVHPGMLAASVAAHVLVLGFGVWVWSRVLRHFEHPPVPLGALQRIWFLSNLARYVPGKVFQFVAVAQLSRNAGLSGAVLLTSMLVHTGITLMGSLVVASWTLSQGVFRGVDPRWAGVAAMGAALVSVHPALLNRVLAAIPRLLKRDVIRWNGTWAQGAGLVALSVVSWGLYGVAYHLFVASLAPLPWRLMPQMAGVNALSFFAGYWSPLPGGGGLREASMTLFLKPYLPQGVAAVLSLAARLWTIAAELIGGGAALLLARGALGKVGRGADDGAAAEDVPVPPAL
ncbi:MAG TPA: lysylphosphatidylglycerol synthase domain-containing protein, partial [Longimicrobium sp.]|uniref:lysylphosphatidylglycerol synthase domain-containing protein n=1 Tax=Longimicrobium sp. TaxID=2029185 RepID=UPI002ED8F790